MAVSEQSAPAPDAGPEPAGPAAPTWRDAARTLAVAVSWTFVAVLAGVLVSIWTGTTPGAAPTVLLQSLVPILFLPAWVIGATALAKKRWWLGGACAVLAVAHVALVVPALGSDARPAWAAAAPKLDVLSANLFNHNRTPDAAAARVVATDADVLVLVEVAPAMRAALVRAGIDRKFPYQLVARASHRGDTDGIYSRVPFTGPHVYAVLVNELPSVILTVGGRSVRLVGVHIDGAQHGAAEWRGELEALGPIARAEPGALVIAGDFNATRWNPPFRDLLGAGLHDAHEARGRGLSRSWPVRATRLATFGPLMRLDHALVNRRVAVEEVHDVSIPGSDHLGFRVRLAIGP